ncbi:hypothetical protein [Hyalangium rubrum]|uniref:Lipoprotein n=1 Tax=Hyalangium rubrum TaxID=3103134 RepID=A0ABU5HE43_9BACT|nr:hypothetical protein [Hyalangium sp. s54d21]MDY7231412.1 hypothetical protein [Hyalangium sp. s54d21]
MSRIHVAGKVVLLGAVLAMPAFAQEKGDKDVCGSRPRCEVKDSTPALKGHTVVELALGPRDPEEGAECEQREWWLRRPDKSVVKLLDACNDGYGAAGMGEDEVAIDGNRFTATRSGGSNWRWSNTVVAQLSPLSLLREEHRTFATVSPETSESRFDFVTFESRVSRQVADCKLDPGDVSPDSDTTSTEASVLPRVELPADFLQEGWKRTGLGRCSARSGFVLLGKPQDKVEADAHLLAVLAQDNVLFLEVSDDTWTGPSAKWLADDHVELWLSPEGPEAADPCERSGKDVGLVQWAIRIADGKVFPAYGDPKPPLQAEVVREAGRARLKVKLPSEVRALSAVYSDSDAGKKQELLVATSQVQFGRAATLSPVREFERAELSCQLKGAELTPVPAELRPASGESALSVE